LYLHRLMFVAALAAALFLSQASTAQAQCMSGDPTCNEVGAAGKGIMGGLILGAEIGLMTNALIVSAGVRELDEWWAWILWPAVFGAGGAVAGYFALEDPTYGMSMTRGSPEGAVALFAISMALIVPTFVGVLALTAYSPGADTAGGGATGEEDAEDGPPPEDTSSAEPIDGEPAVQEPAPEADQPADDGLEGRMRDARSRVLAGGPGLLRFDGQRVLLGLPMIYATDMFTPQERAHAHLPQLADLRVPVVSGAF
jgi:hypothetical protein